MTVTSEVLAALVAINLSVMGINIKFLFTLWADLKEHKRQCVTEWKDLRQCQADIRIHMMEGCRDAQTKCQQRIIDHIQSESKSAKEEAKQIASALRDSNDQRYEEFARFGRDLRERLVAHMADRDVHVGHKNHGGES
jgi:hypothetical protein